MSTGFIFPEDILDKIEKLRESGLELFEIVETALDYCWMDIEDGIADERHNYFSLPNGGDEITEKVWALPDFVRSHFVYVSWFSYGEHEIVEIRVSFNRELIFEAS